MNREQVPPEALSTQQENALICEKLLGFKKHCDEPDCPDWRTPTGQRYFGSPSFTTWADAGLIVSEFNRRKLEVDINIDAGECWVTIWNPKPRSTTKSADLPPLIRAAALEYIRSLP